MPLKSYRILRRETSSTDDEEESAPIRKIKRSFRYLRPDYDEDDVCKETRDNYKLFTSSSNSVREVNYSLYKVDNKLTTMQNVYCQIMKQLTKLNHWKVHAGAVAPSQKNLKY